MTRRRVAAENPHLVLRIVLMNASPMLDTRTLFRIGTALCVDVHNSLWESIPATTNMDPASYADLIEALVASTSALCSLTSPLLNMGDDAPYDVKLGLSLKPVNIKGQDKVRIYASRTLWLPPAFAAMWSAEDLATYVLDHEWVARTKKKLIITCVPSKLKRLLYRACERNKVISADMPLPFHMLMSTLDLV